MDRVKAFYRFLENSDKVLPGETAQRLLVPSVRSTFPGETKRKKIEAAVLIVVYKKKNLLYMAFMKRAFHKNDKHSGQISFPGGKREVIDKDLFDTAKREFAEEMGVYDLEVEHSFALSPLFIPISNFSVYPFFVYTENQMVFRPDESEVARVIEVPMEELFRIENYEHRRVTMVNGVMGNVPTFNYDGEVVWGATAMILGEWLTMLNPEFAKTVEDKLSQSL